VTAADHANTIRRIHSESGPIYGDDGFDAALDALQAQAETDARERERLTEYKTQADLAYRACYERKDEYMRRMMSAETDLVFQVERAETAEAERDAAVQAAEQAQAALQQIADLGWDNDDPSADIARAALARNQP
jgi:hypothetical protein